LRSKGKSHEIKEWEYRVAVMAVDAATTGRMGITFYREMGQGEYLDRIIDWHETCCWWFRRKNADIVSAPSANRIIAAVYGEPKGDGYAKIQKQARERLLHMILCGGPLDRGWLVAAVARVSNPFSYNKKDGGWDKGKWSDAVNVTCAIVRKYFLQKNKEAFSLELETTCSDRDYLFGRLLAIADRLENHARYLQTLKDDTDKRPTNAVRYMTAFTSKPMRMWHQIFKQLNPYIQRLNGAEGYQRQIDDIMEQLLHAEGFNDKPLGGKYLLGYSLQRKAMQHKKEDIHEHNEKN
jgi:CRISPR-associated protein Csd1